MTEPQDPTPPPEREVPTTSDGPGGDERDPAGTGRAGGIRFQDPSTATPRPPTLAEQRERERARREAEAAAWEQARRDTEDAQKRARRRTQLIGGAVAVGLVGTLALVYLAAADDGGDYDSAQCVNEEKVVVDDKYCESSQGSYGPNGMWLFFVGGSRYQYSYGSNAPIGQRANGSLTPAPGKSYANPSGKAVTSNGKTGGPVSRGGFGSKAGSGGKSGSGSSGKSVGG